MAHRTEIVHVTAWFFEVGDQLPEADIGWLEDFIIDGRKGVLPLDEDPLVVVETGNRAPEPNRHNDAGSRSRVESIREAEPDYSWRVVRSFVGLEPSTLPIGHGGDEVWVSSWIDYDVEQIGADEVWHEFIDDFPAACTKIALELRNAREATLGRKGVTISGIKAIHFLVAVDCFAGRDDDGVEYTFLGLVAGVKTAHGAQRDVPHPTHPPAGGVRTVTLGELMSMPNYERIALSPGPRAADFDKGDGEPDDPEESSG